MAENEKFIVQSAIPERLYVKIYHDFLDSELIGGKEKLIFILLKRYLNFKEDKSGISGSVYPTLSTLSKQSGMTEKTVREIIKQLERKGLIEIKQRGLTFPNIYILKDFSAIWKSKTVQEAEAAIEEQDDLAAIERLKAKGYIVTAPVEKPENKKIEHETISPTKAIVESSPNFFNSVNNNDTVNIEKSQEKKHPKINIRNYFDFDALILDTKSEAKKELIEVVIGVLDKTINTTSETVVISGQKINSEAVRSRLMKLSKEAIDAAIDDFDKASKETKIKNAEAYILAVLYNKPEQFPLQLHADVNFDMAHWNDNGNNT